MKTLITPAQTVELAFTDGEYISAETISASDIAAAEARYIVPVIGAALHSRLLDGGYPDFTADFLAPAVALYTRLGIQPRLDIRSGQCGTTAPRTTGGGPASEQAILRFRQSLRTKARLLLRRASEHLDTAAANFPEYDQHHNILKHCSTDGNLVQIH